MDKTLRNTLRNVVTQCRRLLEQAVGEMLQGQYGIHASGEVEPAVRISHLSAEERQYRERVLVHLEHIKSSGLKPRDAVAQLVREASFTHLNRLCAYKMMSQRGLMRDAVGKVLKSGGFLFYLVDHPEDEALYNGAQQETAYRHFLEWLNVKLSEEIGVLFSPDDLASGLFPPHRVLEGVLEQLNHEELKSAWAEDETIGWVYQYFTPKELRDKARKESAAPRNSYEMAFRNQFFTPRYVVEFLTDNTLGRTWYEMRSGDTALKERCRYLAVGENGEEQASSSVSARQKKDPREIKVLDPACGSGHFLLYCFDLLQTIYEEAYTDAELGPHLQSDFPDAREFKRAVPGLILAHNLHGIDIDLRVTQLAALALWLRAQRAFQEMGLKSERPKIRRDSMHLVCAEPMPGEEDLLAEFTAELRPRLLGELVRKVFERMKLAGEAGALIRIEDDISEPLEAALKQWQEMVRRDAERREHSEQEGTLFEWRRDDPQQKLGFDLSDITDEDFWHEAEGRVVESLREYARRAGNGEGLLRRLFASDAEQGFAFVDLCRQKFDVVLMNPPFGDASIPSKPYIDETYGDTRGDVYKAFVECFQDRLVPGGFLGIISSRTGFFLSGSSDWRERIVLRLYRPLLLADFGIGVLDAMVETAAYVLRSLTEEEDRQLTLHLAKSLPQVPTDKKDLFSTKKYEDTFGLKRHQANGELRRLYEAGFIKPVEGRFPRWTPLEGEIARAPEPSFAPYPPLICLRLLGEDDKAHILYTALHDASNTRVFKVRPEEFALVPNKAFSYWVSYDVRLLFKKLPLLESNGRAIRIGLATTSDPRFVRLWSEVSPADTQKNVWVPYAKGGAFSPFYQDIHLVVDWEEEGRRIKERVRVLGDSPSRYVENEDKYFEAGLTYPRRTQRGFNVRILPSGCIFANKGPSIFKDNDHASLLMLLAIMNSQMFRTLLSLQMAFGSYEVGVVQRTPIPKTTSADEAVLGKLGLGCITLKRVSDSSSETSHVFHLPAPLQVNGDSLTERVAAWQARIEETERQLAAHQREIDDITFSLYGIGEEDRRAIEASVTGSTSHVEDEQAETDDEAEDEQASADGRQLAADLVSYAIGCAFARWDARFATGERPAPELPDPFAPLPVCAPGALTGADGLPINEAPNGYPLRADSDGILVDDPEHDDDLVGRLREVFELVWPESAEAREREACELLGVKTLRDYFRKPAAGGFWMDHVRRYSKSRRKAPIYWLLQSSRKSYAVWLYYHRLDKDILYKVLLNYVEPKIRLEENTLSQLHTRREAAGTGGREAKQLEKQLERQEALLSELHDFRDKLQRAASLNLEPDHNDGVVLNIAPLRELVPWTEAKKYWNELLEGKYEWSSISKQLRARGIVQT